MVVGRRAARAFELRYSDDDFSEAIIIAEFLAAGRRFRLGGADREAMIDVHGVGLQAVDRGGRDDHNNQHQYNERGHGPLGQSIAPANRICRRKGFLRPRNKPAVKRDAPSRPRMERSYRRTISETIWVRPSLSNFQI